ncbi:MULTISPECIES: hypothetical protein [unclassified Brevundimonas]|nr:MULTISPECIES: hypothetical protein [unclassified Brevundimonas]
MHQQALSGKIAVRRAGIDYLPFESLTAQGRKIREKGILRAG